MSPCEQQPTLEKSFTLLPALSRRHNTSNTPCCLNMALRKNSTTERDISSGYEANADVNIHKGDYYIRSVPEKPELFSPKVDSPFLVAVNAISLVLWFLYFWTKFGSSAVRRRSQATSYGACGCPLRERWASLCLTRFHPSR